MPWRDSETLRRVLPTLRVAEKWDRGDLTHSLPSSSFLPVVITSFSPLVENSTCRSHRPSIVFHVKASSGSMAVREIRARKSPKRAEGPGEHISTFTPYLTLPGQGFSTHSPEEMLPLLSCAHSPTTLTCTKCSHQHFSALPGVGRLHRMLPSYLFWEREGGSVFKSFSNVLTTVPSKNQQTACDQPNQSALPQISCSSA